MSASPRERYAADLRREDFVADPAQARAVEALQGVYERLLANPPKRRFGALSRLTWPRVDGLYLWGSVGRGKTYLMDVFFESLPFTRKRRTHFHRFMLEVHARRNRYPDEQDPLVHVADEIAETTRVLCFDEFFVSDIADAMILGRLFETLFKRGLTLIATSNVAPDDLYRDGLQRERFLPAIERLKQNCLAFDVDGDTDYRLRSLHEARLYLSPCDAPAMEALGRAFDKLVPHGRRERTTVQLNDRPLAARCIGEGGAWFEFRDLCEAPRAAADYVELARTHHTIVLSAVPQLGEDAEDAARRFITLVDEFYDRGVKLLLCAAVPLEALYAGARLSFEFERTRSRLIEMQSREYLAKPHLT